MSDILDDEVEQPPVEVKVETPEQTEETGEQAAPPAEPPQESNEDARRKGIEAALLAERRRRQALEEQLQRLQQPQEAPKEAGPPDPNAYQDNPAEYWRLLARHEAQEALKDTIRQQQEQHQRHQAVRQQQEKAARVNDMVTKGQLKYADFDPVINNGLAPFLTPALHEELADSEVGHELAYFLGRNPIEADKVARLQGKALTREITRLEDKLKAPERPAIPSTLTQSRDSRGQFHAAPSGPTSLNDILGIKPD
jgi:hypothetical protein